MMDGPAANGMAGVIVPGTPNEMTESENRNQLHLHVAGADRPGILADVLAFIVESECLVVDIKQFVFNGLLNLSLLVESRDDLK